MKKTTVAIRMTVLLRDTVHEEIERYNKTALVTVKQNDWIISAIVEKLERGKE